MARIQTEGGRYTTLPEDSRLGNRLQRAKNPRRAQHAVPLRKKPLAVRRPGIVAEPAEGFEAASEAFRDARRNPGVRVIESEREQIAFASAMQSEKMRPPLACLTCAASLLRAVISGFGSPVGSTGVLTPDRSESAILIGGRREICFFLAVRKINSRSLGPVPD